MFRMATYQEIINQEIGAIIKSVQYIEWNLLNKLNKSTFDDMTLGQIKNLIIEKRIIKDDDAIDELEQILDRRNDLVHKYFKRKDFEKHCQNKPFLENECRYLTNFREQVEHFNKWLCGK